MMATGAREPRCMLMGAVGAGKTTLLHTLLGDGATARKTQTEGHLGWCLDTPGEYAEIGAFRHRLMALASEVRVLLVVQDATRERSCFPPAFLRAFPRPAIGIVTKTDLVEAGDVERAARLLREAGVVGDIHPVSATHGTGLAALRQRLTSCLAGRPGENDNGNCSG